MKYQRPRGVNDILPADIGEWQFAENSFRDLCRRYCFDEIRTPIFEETDLFKRSVGEQTDIVSKEMYTFEDRSDRSLTLRAEGTAPTIRAFIENNLQGQDLARVTKLYYIAPIFRYEKPQAGRYRQHHQCGIEALGSQDPALDAEICDLAITFYAALGITQVKLMVNSVGCPNCAPGYAEALKAFLGDRIGEMCGDCRARFDRNPRRILDCKVPGCKDITQGAPQQIDMLCDECAAHFAGVQENLTNLGIRFEINPRIVRGLDYYTKTAFEFVSEGLGSQDAIGAGGRYDGLVEQCGGRPTPGVGMGIGLERILLVRQNLGIRPVGKPREGLFVIALGDDAWPQTVKLAADLRHSGQRAAFDFRKRSMKAQLRFADAEGFAKAAILGDDEIASGTVSVKDLETGEQVSVARESLLAGG
jgi:histidyl-tRNA synthetase